MRDVLRYRCMDSRHQSANMASGGQRPKPVMAPSRHEGVGNALRTAYDATSMKLPEDMQSLLARLG